MAAKNAEASHALNRAQLAETQQAATRAQEAVANQNARLLALQQRLASNQQQLTDLRASQAAAQAELQDAHQQETASLQQAVEARDAQLHLAQQTEASLQQQLADRTTAHTEQAAANTLEIVALEKDAADNAMLLKAGQARVKYVEDKLVQLRASLHQARADLEQQTAAGGSREAMQSEQIWELQNTVTCHEASMIAADRTHQRSCAASRHYWLMPLLRRQLLQPALRKPTRQRQLCKLRLTVSSCLSRCMQRSFAAVRLL